MFFHHYARKATKSFARLQRVTCNLGSRFVTGITVCGSGLYLTVRRDVRGLVRILSLHCRAYYRETAERTCAVDSERLEAILHAVRGDYILNLGCVNHSIALTDAEKKRWLQLRLSEQFPKANVLGLDIDQKNVAGMRAQGMNAEVGDAQRL